jgi:hypothetical protein
MNWLGIVLLVAAAGILVYAFFAPEEKGNPDRLFWLRRGSTQVTGDAKIAVFRATRALRTLRRNSIVRPIVAVDERSEVFEKSSDVDGDAQSEVPSSAIEPPPAVAEVAIDAPTSPAIEPPPAVAEAAIDAPTSPAIEPPPAVAEAAVDAEPSEDNDTESSDRLEELKGDGRSTKLLELPPVLIDREPLRPPVGRSGRPIIWPRLLELDYTALDTSERVGILRTLAAIDDPQSVPVLCEALMQEDDPMVRDAALEAVRDVRIAEAIDELREALASSRERERLLAVEALSAIGATQELQRALSDSCVAVVTRAARSLERNGAQLELPDVAEPEAKEPSSSFAGIPT